MRSLSQIREIAAQLFKAQWGSSALVLLVYTLIASAASSLSFIPVIGAAAVFCLSIVLQAGVWGAFLKGVRGERMEIEDVFSGFTQGRFGRVLGGGAFMILKVLLWMLPGMVLFIGGLVWMTVATMGSYNAFLYGSSGMPDLSLAAIPALFLILIGYVLMLVMGILKEYSYMLTLPLLMENPGIAPTYACKLSEKIMSGHKWQYFVLSLTFLGWQLLSLFTFGILSIVYVNPWMQMSSCAFYYEVKQEAVMYGRVRPEEFMGARYE